MARANGRGAEIERSFAGMVPHCQPEMQHLACETKDPPVNTSGAAVRELTRRNKSLRDVSSLSTIVTGIGTRAPPSQTTTTRDAQDSASQSAKAQVVRKLTEHHHSLRDAFLKFDNDRGESGVPAAVLRKALLRSMGPSAGSARTVAAIDSVIADASIGADGLVDYASFSRAVSEAAPSSSSIRMPSERGIEGGANSQPRRKKGSGVPNMQATLMAPLAVDSEGDDVSQQVAAAEREALAAMQDEQPAAGLARHPLPFGEPAEDWGDHTLPSSAGHEALLRKHMATQKYRGLRRAVETAIPAHVSWEDIASRGPSAPSTPPGETQQDDASGRPSQVAPPSLPAASERAPHRLTAAERRAGVLRRRINDRVQQLFGSDGSSLRRLYRKFQRGSDGTAQVADVAKGLRAVGVTVSDSDVQLILGGSDAAAGTRVSFDGFCRGVTKGDIDPPSIPHPHIHTFRHRLGTRSDGTAARAPASPPQDADSVALKDARSKIEAAMATSSSVPSKLFLKVDKVRDGVLEHTEVLDGLNDLGVQLSAAEKDAVVAALDPAGTGAVSYARFVSTLVGSGSDDKPRRGGVLPLGGDEPVDRIRRDGMQRYSGVAAAPMEEGEFDADRAMGVDVNGVLVTGRDVMADKLTPAQRHAALLGHGIAQRTVMEQSMAAPRDAYGTPAHYKMADTSKGGQGGLDEVDLEMVEAKAQNAVVRQVVEKLNNKGKARDLFLKLNFNRDGKADVKELRLGLARMGVNLNRKEFDAFTGRIDLDGNGEIDYTEFAKAMSQDERRGDTSFGVVEGTGEDPFLSEMQRWYRPHKYAPPADVSEEDRIAAGLPRLNQDSRQVFASLVSDGAIPSTSLSDARMANEVVDRMARKVGEPHRLYRKLTSGGGVPVAELRQRMLESGLHVSQRQVDALLGPFSKDTIDYASWCTLTKPRGYFDAGIADDAANATVRASQNALAQGRSATVRSGAHESMSTMVARRMHESSGVGDALYQEEAEAMSVLLGGSGSSSPSRRRLPVGVSARNSRIHGTAFGQDGVHAEHCSVSLLDERDLDAGLGDMGSPPPAVGVFGAAGGDMSGSAAAYVSKSNVDPTGTTHRSDALAAHAAATDRAKLRAIMRGGDDGSVDGDTSVGAGSTAFSETLRTTRGAGAGAQMADHPATVEAFEGMSVAGVTPARKRRLRAANNTAAVTMKIDHVRELMQPDLGAGGSPRLARRAATTDDLPAAGGAAGVRSGATSRAGRSRSAVRAREHQGSGAAEAISGRRILHLKQAPPATSTRAGESTAFSASASAASAAGKASRESRRVSVRHTSSHMHGAGAVVPSANPGGLSRQVLPVAQLTAQQRGRHPGARRAFGGSAIFDAPQYGGSPPRQNRWGHLGYD